MLTNTCFYIQVTWSNISIFISASAYINYFASACILYICGCVCLSEPFYKDPELKVLANSEDKVASFVCVAENFSPKHYDIQWLLNNKEISGQISEIRTQTEGQKTENGTVYSATSFLTLPSKNVPTPSKLTCRFKGKNAAGDKTTDKPFTYNPCASCGE